MSDPPETILVRLQGHLRLADHPALYRAAERAETLLPIYVHDDSIGQWGPNTNQLHWRAASVAELRGRFRARGLDLKVLRGDPRVSVPDLANQVGAEAVYWNRRFRPDRRREGRETARRLREAGYQVERFDSELLHDPDAVETTSGGNYHVFTPFWKKFQSTVDIGEPLPPPPLDDLELPTNVPGDGGVELVPEQSLASRADDWWTPGVDGAREQLASFLDEVGAGYDDRRDRLAEAGTSRLSPHLHHGELSARQVWDAVDGAAGDEEGRQPNRALRRQLAWREFAYHLLHHYPETPEEPLKDKFRQFDWNDGGGALERWRRGETGYPVVDAGMRQLEETGWMHNRARMIVASFLTKDLLVHWRRGAEWFWHHLVDADLANNTMGWQWAAGSGADAQPFFRIFNPVSQGERHDPEGAYVRRYVPELADLPDHCIHQPWEADPLTLESADVSLGEDYPRPIVEHAAARERALAEWERIK